MAELQKRPELVDDMMEIALHGIASRLVEDGDLLLSNVRAGANGGTAPAASERAIKALKDAAAVGEGDECVICYVEEDQDHEAARWKEMPCGHRFHGGCLEKWLRARDSCPTCRRSLSPPITRAEWMDLRYNWFVAVQKFQERVAEYTRTHPC